MRVSLSIILLVLGFFLDGTGQLLLKDLTVGTETDKSYFGLIQNIDVDPEGTIYVSDWENKYMNL